MKQARVVTGIWFQNLDGRSPKVFVEHNGTWREALSTSDIKAQRSLIREMYCEDWPAYQSLIPGELETKGSS